MSRWGAIEARLDAFGRWLVEGPGFGWVQIGVGAAAWTFAAGLEARGERVAWLGWLFPAPCGFAARTGLACPSCGATRSWAALVAGDPVRAFGYHPAAALLLVGLGAWVAIGALRVRRGRPGPARPWIVAAAAWFAIAAVGWALRLSGWWPLVIPT